MNISQLLRSVIGDLQVSDAKTLELKVGQVVRGVVLQMLSEQDALMNIGGAQVRAHLEAPLAKGQSALLQVQPESMAGQVVLKPVEASQVQIPEPSLAEILKGFGLKDTPGNRQVLQELHQAKVPLTRDNVQGFADMAARMPEGADESQWRQAALLAIKRGLPLTQETVGSLHRTMFGSGVDRTIQSLAGQLAILLADNGPDQGISAATRNLMGQVKQTLEALPAMPQPAEEAAQPTGASAAKPEAAAAQAAGARQPAGEGAAAQPKAAPLPPEQAGLAPAPAGRDAAGLAAARKAGGDEAAAGTAPAGPPRGVAAAGAPGARAATGGQDQGGEAAPRPAPAQEPAPWVGRLLKALGVQHEQQLARPLEHGGVQHLPPHARPAGADTAPAPAGSTPAQPADADTATLKGLLLQLSAAEDAPSAIREGAQQLVQQVTGQQLLLTPDRASMFTHMTLMLPIMNQTGSQTAAVHIQSRKGPSGQLDARNCHLVFDLDMRTLGTTLVDVQVTDKIVALRVHNDFPEIGTLLEEHREEIREGLEKIGYQLLSMKVLPYPDPVAPGVAGTAGGPTGDSGAAAASLAASRYHAEPYKGVDVRI